MTDRVTIVNDVSVSGPGEAPWVRLRARFPAGECPDTLTAMAIAGLLLLPGAGGGRDDKTLLAIEARMAPLPVARREFANRAAGRKGPEHPERAIAQVGEMCQSFADDLGVSTDQIAVGGRSFGGRMASMAVARGARVGALVLLSYPLHPPGRPDTLRIDHLAQIEAPTLVVSGERDPFGSPDELREHLSVIAGQVRFAWVPGNHSPAPGPVCEAVAEWLMPDGVAS